MGVVNLNTLFMDLFMDFFVLGLVALFLWKIKFYKSLKSYNTEYLSLQSGTMLRGLFALVVVYHHLAQNTTGGRLFRQFTLVGYLAVAVFFFFSGYGLQKKHITDETYSHQFLLRRIPTVLIPYIIMNFIYWLAKAVNGTIYSLTDVFQNLVYDGLPLVNNSWYIICILYFYVGFYFLMRICKKHYIWMIAGACLYNLVWIIICHSLSYGIWWYNASHLIIVGMIWATWEKEITDMIQKYYILFSSIALVVFLLLNYIKIYLGINFLVIDMIIAFDFVIIVNLFSVKFRIGNRILNYLGTISLEIYMIHGLFLSALKQYISNELIFCALVLICSIISAHILHKIFSFILSKYRATLNRCNKTDVLPREERK